MILNMVRGMLVRVLMVCKGGGGGVGNVDTGVGVAAGRVERGVTMTMTVTMIILRHIHTRRGRRRGCSGCRRCNGRRVRA